ncbi:hypothetical protein BgiBS90_026847, partial [Biomphalaria glabrata]
MKMCFFPFCKGSFRVMSLSLFPLGGPTSLDNIDVFMAKLTPDSRRTSVLLPLQKKVYPAPLSQSSPSSASRVSLGAAMSMLYLWSSLATSAVRLCGLSDVSLSSSVRTFHAHM